MKKKIDIDRTVAVLLGLPETDVSRITGAFLREAQRLLVEEGDVNMSGFGRLRLRRENFNGEVTLTAGGCVKGVRKKKQTAVVSGRYRVYFSKSESLQRNIKERFGTEEIHGNEARREQGRDGQVRGRRGRRSERAREGRE